MKANEMSRGRCHLHSLTVHFTLKPTRTNGLKGEMLDLEGLTFRHSLRIVYAFSRVALGTKTAI